MLLNYKYRIKNKDGNSLLRDYAAAVNAVWNYANDAQKDRERRYKAGGKLRWLTAFELQRLTAGVSAYTGLTAQTIQGVCQQYAMSRDAARKSIRYRASSGPKRALGWIPFKRQCRKIAGNSITYRGKSYTWFGGASRPLPETAKGGAFVEDARGRWWVTFIVDVTNEPTGSSEVGIDLGLKALATMSDGQTVPALQHYREYEERLAVAQRAGNKRRARAIHTKIGNVRRDQLHKATTQIARENGLIAVGNVSSSKLAKTRMAKSVLDASWSMFRAQLRYKASRHGAVYVDVDERFTTQVCSACGSNPASSPKGMGGLGIRSWDCSECGVSHDRDVNAARNILRIGRSAAPPVEESRIAA